ncbi:MAG: hypothetical protein HKL84_10020 [Acidimicrobiaceae bacterium]|nr:hypothetical protein [Acidimicrobiaceae bacterium]
MNVKRPSFGENTTLEIAILANFANEIFGIDRETRAFVRFELEPNTYEDLSFNPFALWTVRLSTEPGPADSARPELIEVTQIIPVGQMHRKRDIAHLGKECSSPSSIPILGFNGPSVSYGQITGHSPSVTLIELTKRQAIRKNSYGEITVSFPWGQIIASVPIGNEAERQVFEKADRPLNTAKEIASVLGFQPKYVLVALAKPKAGYCRKMAVGLLPEKISRRTAKKLRARQIESASSAFDITREKPTTVPSSANR